MLEHANSPKPELEFVVGYYALSGVNSVRGSVLRQSGNRIGL